MQETRILSLGRQDPWRKKWQPTPVSLPGKAHGQRSLVGCSPWDHKESNPTEQHTTLISEDYGIRLWNKVDKLDQKQLRIREEA